MKELDKDRDGNGNYCRECDARRKGRPYKSNKRTKRRRVEIIKTDAQKRYERREQRLKSKYGITIETYNKMYASQHGKCLICGLGFLNYCEDVATVRNSLVVDHCHSTGKVRGLLCQRCNVSLGFMERLGDNLQLAIEYLKKNEG